MSKYYVQCGPLQLILLARSSRQAALSAVDRMMQNHLWIYDDPDLHDGDQRDHFGTIHKLRYYEDRGSHV